MIKKLTSYFRPPDAGDDIQILINVFLITIVLCLLGTLNALGLGLHVIAGQLLIQVFGCLSLLFLIKHQKTGKIFATHVYAFLGLSGMILQAWYQGGLVSAAIASFFLVPAITMLLAGKKMATIWFGIVVLSMIGYFIYEYQNGPLPPHYKEEDKLSYYLSATLSTTTFIFLILLAYETAKNKAIERLHQKNLDLTLAQAQLIQSEKMASLGELTAGIAHEIQNPLNFVNNFSEVSSELVDDLTEELEMGGIEQAKAISSDLKANLYKITNHGKRASSIVRGMLEHSRSSSGKKEWTDINALASEYLRLAYHCLRAQDKGFDAEFQTDFDPNLPKIEVIPQDIGRVLLNLINNAFQACAERSRKEKAEQSAVGNRQSANDSNSKPASADKLAEGTGAYHPMVKVKTELTADGRLLIAVSDNGPGISDDIKDKIFQPFFTTKPTGKGTGLGLSLAYDIITSNNGQLKVDSAAGEGSTFTIVLLV